MGMRGFNVCPTSRYESILAPEVYQLFFRNVDMAGRLAAWASMSATVCWHMEVHRPLKVRVIASARSTPAPIAILRVPGRLGQDATTRLGGLPRVILIRQCQSRLRCSSLL
jgi:hypothetical protein